MASVEHRLVTLRQDPETKRLTGQIRQIGDKAVLSPPAMLLFGLPFAGVGVFMLLLGMGRVDIANAPRGSDAAVLCVLGSIFILGGLMVWGMGAQAWASLRGLEKRRARHPFSPVLQDWKWGTAGQSYPRWKRALQGAAGLSFATLFLLPFFYVFSGKDTPFFVFLILSLFGLLLLWGWGCTAYLFWRALRHPGGSVAYASFPLPAAGKFEIIWSPGRPLCGVKGGRIVLRCVREFWERRRVGGKESSQLVHEQVFALEGELAPAALDNAARLSLPFELPAGLPASRLSGAGTVFWRLEIGVDLPGVDLYEEYLLPVY
jgi:hypothetical protein